MEFKLRTNSPGIVEFANEHDQRVVITPKKVYASKTLMGNHIKAVEEAHAKGMTSVEVQW